MTQPDEHGVRGAGAATAADRDGRDAGRPPEGPGEDEKRDSHETDGRERRRA
ncbi:hypothetical protein Ssi03_26630 [Sphaerisporangium siamense]|nr:hypothetical protein Ssi03_26630 [Sphaerisporangium siamense]